MNRSLVLERGELGHKLRDEKSEALNYFPGVSVDSWFIQRWAK